MRSMGVTGDLLPMERKTMTTVENDMTMVGNHLDEYGEYPVYSWSGGYRLYYVTADGGFLCAECANENKDLTEDPDDPQWFIVGCDVNYEDPDLICDHCGKELSPEYVIDE